MQSLDCSAKALEQPHNPDLQVGVNRLWLSTHLPPILQVAGAYYMQSLDYSVKALEQPLNPDLQVGVKQLKRKNKWALALLIKKEYSPDDF
jgi:hypothetical protein